MATPNLMVESSVTDLADMMTALSFHVGEVQRNPYHLLVPAWMQDNVRRGESWSVGRGAAPDFVFCTLCRLRRWIEGRLQATYAGGRSLAARHECGDPLRERLMSGESIQRQPVTVTSVMRFAAPADSTHEIHRAERISVHVYSTISRRGHAPI